MALLCIDEVGYLSFDDKSADLLYKVINRRYEQKSLILTTNKPFKEWNEVFPNAACIATSLGRLPHHAEVTVIEELCEHPAPENYRDYLRLKLRQAAKTLSADYRKNTFSDDR